MMRTYRGRRALLAAAGAAPLMLLGCAGTSPPAAPDRYVSAQFVRPPAGSLVLLLHLPANEAVYRSRDADARQRVQDELTKAGYRVGLVEPDDYLLALRAEAQQLQRVTAAPSREQWAAAEMRALSTVSKVGAQLAGSHLLLRTRFLTRPAEIWQSYAKWDGVSRIITFEGAKPGEVRALINGNGSGISLEAVAADRDGRLLLKNYGGVALPFHANFLGRPLLLDNPMSVLQHLDEGVGIAIAPLTGR